MRLNCLIYINMHRIMLYVCNKLRLGLLTYQRPKSHWQWHMFAVHELHNSCTATGFIAKIRAAMNPILCSYHFLFNVIYNYFTYVVEQLLFFLCTKVVSRGLKKEYLSFSIVFITSFICIGDKVADTKSSIHYHFSVQSMFPSKVLPV